ncbi:MAG: nucleoside triphosphate pyrophosphohydrolase [Anaerolineales bacterium]
MESGVTIVGLGPGDPGLISRTAWDRLTAADRVFLRTSMHPAVETIPFKGEVESFDPLYEDSDSFQAVYRQIVDRLMVAAKFEKIVYAVPGDPGVGEATTAQVRSRAEEQGIPLRIIHGISFIEPSLAALAIDALDGLVVVDALELMDRHHPSFPPDYHILISQIHSQLIASDIKLTLMNQYPEGHPITLLSAAGTEGESIEHKELYELDRETEFGSMSCLYIPPMEEGSSFESFQELVAHLRSPEGCPWDREQTHLSLRQHMLEEAYETLEALDAEDPQELEEELGDLMLQLVLQTQIAVEEGEFLMADVLRGIHQKLVRRHPHVFGDVDVEDVPEVLSNWEGLKAAERQEGGKEESALAGVPKSLPALAQAEEYQSRAARLGFDWPEASGVLAKIQEELAEVAEAEGELEQAAEIGDLLFAVVNYARWLKVDPEASLRQANAKFRARFRKVEDLSRNQDQRLAEMNLDQLNALWEQAKHEEGQR